MKMMVFIRRVRLVLALLGWGVKRPVKGERGRVYATDAAESLAMALGKVNRGEVNKDYE